MYKVGITGGIGTGKSIVCRIFSSLNIPVYDADSRARWLMENHPDIRLALINWLGEEVYADGQLNRSFLASVAFKDPETTETLNRLTHPSVRDDFNDWILKHENAPYIIKEAALLYESGSCKDLDSMIVVSAPMDLRIERILKRDPQRSRQQVLDIIERQWPDEKKLSLADYIIYNDEQAPVIEQVLILHQNFMSKLLL
jgi:dephospho-CoA kinase